MAMEIKEYVGNVPVAVEACMPKGSSKGKGKGGKKSGKGK